MNMRSWAKAIFRPICQNLMPPREHPVSASSQAQHSDINKDGKTVSLLIHNPSVENIQRKVYREGAETAAYR